MNVFSSSRQVHTLKKHRFAVLRGLVAFYQAASHGKHHSVIPYWLLDWRLCCNKNWSRLMLVRCWERSKPGFCGTSSWSHSEWKIKNPWPLTWHRVAGDSYFFSLEICSRRQLLKVTDSRDKRELITQWRRISIQTDLDGRISFQEGELFFLSSLELHDIMILIYIEVTNLREIQLDTCVPEHPQISGLATWSKGADMFCLGWWVLRTADFRQLHLPFGTKPEDSYHLVIQVWRKGTSRWDHHLQCLARQDCWTSDGPTVGFDPSNRRGA